MAEHIGTGAVTKEILASYDNFTIADAVKHCLRTKYAPLIPYDMFNEFIAGGEDVDSLSTLMLDVPVSTMKIIIPEVPLSYIYYQPHRNLN